MTTDQTIQPFDSDPDDAVLEVTADEFAVRDAAMYARGWELLQGFDALKKKIEAHYEKIRKPIQATKKAAADALKNVNQMEADDLKEPLRIKSALSERLMQWKREQDERDAAEARALQAAEDARALAEQQARLKAIADAQEQATIPAVKQSFAAEHHAVAPAPPVTRAVKSVSSVPKIPGGHTMRTWRAEVFDLKALLTAYLAGTVHLDDQTIITALQPMLNTHAVSLRQEITAAFPGVKATFNDTPVVKR